MELGLVRLPASLKAGGAFHPMNLFPRVALVILCLAALCGARADSPAPAQLVSLDSLAAFRPVTNNWRVAGGLGGDPARSRDIVPLPGSGIVVSNPVEGGTNDQLFTVWEHGDLELDVEFLLTPRTNSGI